MTEKIPYKLKISVNLAVVPEKAPVQF